MEIAKPSKNKKIKSCKVSKKHHTIKITEEYTQYLANERKKFRDIIFNDKLHKKQHDQLNMPRANRDMKDAAKYC